MSTSKVFYIKFIVMFLLYVDVQQRNPVLNLNNSDMISSHKLMLPQASKLLQTIKPLADLIVKLSKTTNQSLRRSFKSTSNDSASDALSAVANDSGLNDEEKNEKHLNSTLELFVDTMFNHLQAVVNTAVQMKWESTNSR